MRSLIRMASSKLPPSQRHERHQDVLAQRQFAVLGRGAIGDRAALRHPIAFVDDRALIDAGALVRAHELAQAMRVLLALVIQNDDLAGGAR